MAFLFQDLRAYQYAIDFADRVLSVTRTYPRGYGFLANQLRRAAVSIPANLAEGNGRRSAADRLRFFDIARGSLQECVALMELARRHDLINEHRHVQLQRDLEAISKMIGGLAKRCETDE